MTTASVLQAAVATQAVRDLTQYSGTETAYSATVLASAATAGEGMFARLTGIVADSADALHVGPLIACCLYYLELWKGRDRQLVQDARRVAENECRELKALVSVSPQTTSTLTTIVPEVADTYPDMSPKNFKAKPSSLVGDRATTASVTDTSPE